MPIGCASCRNPSISFAMLVCSIVCSVISLRPLLVLLRARQLAEEDQRRRLEEVALLGELLDRVAAVEQHALVAVDVGDPALAVAVFMNAGSYVIMPNSSGVTLIWRRSVALMVPSWIGTSYCLPVRLSVIVSVSAIWKVPGANVPTVLTVRRCSGLGVVRSSSGSVGSAGTLYPPVSQRAEVRHLAALAAERTPRRVRRLPPAVDATASSEVPKPPNCIG